MKGRYQRAAVVVLGIAVVALVLAALVRPREPVYHGKRLSQWLDEYNQAGAWNKTGPVSEAIRAMGTNTLPFLLAHIKHRESTIKYKLAPLFWKHQFLKLPSYLRYPYHDTSILALYALGSNATPILPELSKLFEEHSTADGRLSLLGIGTNSIPTLIKLCQSANAEVRIEAAITMATMKANPPPSFEWSWGADPVNHRSIFLIMTSIPDNSFPEIVKMLRHPDPAVRRASADVIGCFGPSKQPFLKLITRSAMPSLIEALKDVNQDVRRSAEKALKKIEPEAAAKPGLK